MNDSDDQLSIVSFRKIARQKEVLYTVFFVIVRHCASLEAVSVEDAVHTRSMQLIACHLHDSSQRKKAPFLLLPHTNAACECVLSHLSVCLCVYIAFTFESHFAMPVYSFRIFRSDSYMKVIGSRSRSQSDAKSVSIYPVRGCVASID